MNRQTKTAATTQSDWRVLVAKYQKPGLRKSIWQIVNSFGGLFVCFALAVWGGQVSYWLTLLFALPAAGFLMRIFVIQHDCGHGSFFKSRRANDMVGIVCSVFTLVAYKYWRRNHAIHHAHHAELEERGIGDVWTLTVNEYLQANWRTRLLYRIFRNPFFLFSIAPTFNFVILERIPFWKETASQKGERASVWWTNAAIVGWLALASVFLGFGTVAMIYLPIIAIAATIGTWLFYVQHQFERTYWEHTPQWDYTLAALEGSSYYQLPRVLQWFTGNIGYHHIHHLSPRIPNYHLQECHEAHPLFQRVVHLTIASSLQTAWLSLWDEEGRRLVSFRDALQTRTSADPVREMV